jgi:hypothetical protein
MRDEKAPEWRMRAIVAAAALILLACVLPASAHTFFFHTIKSASIVPPTSISPSHSSNFKTISISWNAGSGNGTCKLQYMNASSTYVDATPTTLDCDAAASGIVVTMGTPSPWTAAGQARAIRLVRNSDGAVLGTYGAMLTCSSRAGSAGATPNVDEDCNGTWDNTKASKTCGTMTASRTCVDQGGGSASSTQASAADCLSNCQSFAVNDTNPGDACCVYSGTSCMYQFLGTFTTGSGTATACPASTLYY